MVVSLYKDIQWLSQSVENANKFAYWTGADEEMVSQARLMFTVNTI